MHEIHNDIICSSYRDVEVEAVEYLQQMYKSRKQALDNKHLKPINRVGIPRYL